MVRLHEQSRKLRFAGACLPSRHADNRCGAERFELFGVEFSYEMPALLLTNPACALPMRAYAAGAALAVAAAVRVITNLALKTKR
jgi:hypothetical protein